MGTLDNLGDPISVIPGLFRRDKPRSIADALEGATISRLIYLRDLGMYGGTQFLMELRDHRIAIVMAAPAPRDILGQPKGEYAWHLSLHLMKQRLIVTKTIERHVTESRATLGEAPPDEIQRRVEGQTIRRVLDSKQPIPPHASKGLKLELANGVDFFIFPVPPDRADTGITAELHIEARERDRLISTGPLIVPGA